MRGSACKPPLCLPNRAAASQDARCTLATVFIMCTGMRMVEPLSVSARAIDWRIHQVA